MSHRTMLRYPHKAEIYQKVQTPQPSGQKLASWELESENAPCQYNPDRAYIRIIPTNEHIDKIVLFFPPSANLTYGTRISNIRDKKGNTILSGPFEIVTILTFPTYSGKLHHYLVKAELVSE